MKSTAKRNWTDTERKTLRKMFPTHYTMEVAQKLGRSYRSVCSQAVLMGLKKSEAFMKMELQRQADRLRTAGVNNRFQKGQIPMNKGQKMPPEIYKKCKPTMFRKGQVPHNTRYDGHERLSKDGYVEVRVRKGKYVLKHRLVWEQHHGKVPKGYVVAFKDRNPMNLIIENLELITRVENMNRNTIHRFPEELKSTIRAFNKLKRTIDEKQN